MVYQKDNPPKGALHSINVPTINVPMINVPNVSVVHTSVFQDIEFLRVRQTLVKVHTKFFVSGSDKRSVKVHTEFLCQGPTNV